MTASLRRICCCLCLGLAGVALCSSPAEGVTEAQKRKIQALRSRLNNLSRRRVATRQALQVPQRKEQRLSDQLNGIYQRLESATDALQDAERRLRAAEAAEQECATRLARAEARLREQRRRFGLRLAYYYKEGESTFVELLFGAADLTDFLDREFLISRLMEQDVALVDELRKTQSEVARERTQLAERRKALALAHAEKSRHLVEAAQQAAERERLLGAISREREYIERQLREMEEDSAEIQHALERELSRRAASPGTYQRFPAWTGSFFPPARGVITSGFGYRNHPILRRRKMHTGIDIGARMGSPVYAAADGEVFFASWRGGYGRCIILLHGGDVSTLYGHLSRINVSQGQTVKRGQVIGAVGSTGLSTGPHLHFEVRRRGVPVNPR